MADIEPYDIPLPRESMVTVRLSDTVRPTNVVEEGSADLDDELENSAANSAPSTCRTSNSSRRSSRSSATNSVNWEGLEKTEEQEPRSEGTDESTALLLARLEQENNALAHDPKSGLVTGRSRSDTRPPSIHYLKKLVTGPQRQSLRYSLLPAPPMTELEFWAALVKDYPQTCQRLPTLTSNKLRGGVPPPLRGVVWSAITGAHDSYLHGEYQRLANEQSPYDGLIGKDVGRSFPNVEMFREKGGEGQLMLGRVLKAFSLYDQGIGYCQGLGLIVGPLLMHMSEPEAFCVLVRLMEHYDLRSCYTPDLAGLHLRIYQFQALLSRHCPEVFAHLSVLNIEPLYVSQWFLSFFAVTCPLPMLLRIYDVILSEGATETLMRVALSLMQRNEKRLLACTEFEDAMQFLLSRGLWDTYAQHADDMVADFVSLTNLVSRESLQSLENDFKQSQASTATSTLRSAASSLLGRFWAGSVQSPTKSGGLTVTIPKSPSASLRKMSSRTSLISTSHLTESAASETSTLATELSEDPALKADSVLAVSLEVPNKMPPNKTNRDLHHQIEELLTALNTLQRQQMDLALDLQREREERAEERDIASSLLAYLHKQQSCRTISTDHEPVVGKGEDNIDDEERELNDLLEKAESQFSMNDDIKRTSIVLSKHQLRDDAVAWKEKHDAEAARCKGLMMQLDEKEAEHHALKESLKEARARIQDTHRDKQKLEKTVQDLRFRQSYTPDTPTDVYTPPGEFGDLRLPAAKGLREFKLGRAQSPTRNSVVFSKRSSSLQSQPVVVADNRHTMSADSLVIELAMAKTAEAIAKQELEETKGKLEALRKIVSGPVSTPGPRLALADMSLPATGTPTPNKELPTVDGGTTPKFTHAPSSSISGFFSGWGRK